MIVIPMAGSSSRFFKAGYTQPKYMLESHGVTLFEYAVNSFTNYFSTETFIFIIRDVFETYNFVKRIVDKIGIKNYHIHILDHETRGQAETVYLGLRGLKIKGIRLDGALTVFNIDTFRPGYLFPQVAKNGFGYLEVFKGTGDNWSYVLPVDCSTTRIRETAEKKIISDLCCTGLYHFPDVDSFISSYLEFIKIPKSQWSFGEIYIAPLYNFLIKDGMEIHYHLISKEEVIFCGVPSEYNEFLNKEL